MRTLIQKKYKRKIVTDCYYSAELKLNNFGFVYQFNLRDVDSSGASFLINENSSIFKQLKPGMVLEMRFWDAEETRSVEFANATVTQIEKQNDNPHKNNYLIRIEFQNVPGFDSEKQKNKVLRSPQKSKDNGDRRKRPDRRIPSESDYSPERRTGRGRRNRTERRSGLDRRSARQLKDSKSKKN